MAKYYIYNAEKYRYERYAPSRKERMRNLGLVLLGAFMVMGVFLVINFMVLGDISLDIAKTQKTKLSQQITDYKLQMRQIGLSVEDLHKNDQGYFRSILGMPKIADSKWNAGFGGSKDSAYADFEPDLREALMMADKLEHKFRLQKKSFAQLTVAAKKNGDELRRVPTLRPHPGRIISGFGYRRNPVAGGIHFHPGLDFDCRYGDPIYSVAEGTVIKAEFSAGGYGNEVEIDHGYGYVTKYAHMSKIGVKVGQKVKRKQVIGYVGNTGYSIGPHLHYEVIKNGVKVDPRSYILLD